MNQAWTVWKQPQGQRGRGDGSGGGHVGSQGLGYGERAGTPRAVQSGAQEHLLRRGHLAWARFAPLGCGGGWVVRGGGRGRRVSEASGAPSPRREACLRPHLGSLSLLPGPCWRPSQWDPSSLGVTVPQGRPGPGGRSPGEGHPPRTEALPRRTRCSVSSRRGQHTPLPPVCLLFLSLHVDVPGKPRKRPPTGCLKTAVPSPGPEDRGLRSRRLRAALPPKPPRRVLARLVRPLVAPGTSWLVLRTPGLRLHRRMVVSAVRTLPLASGPRG